MFGKGLKVFLLRVIIVVEWLLAACKWWQQTGGRTHIEIDNCLSLFLFVRQVLAEIVQLFLVRWLLHRSRLIHFEVIIDILVLHKVISAVGGVHLVRRLRPMKTHFFGLVAHVLRYVNQTGTVVIVTAMTGSTATRLVETDWTRMVSFDLEEVLFYFSLTFVRVTIKVTTTSLGWSAPVLNRLLIRTLLLFEPVVFVLIGIFLFNVLFLDRSCILSLRVGSHLPATVINVNLSWLLSWCNILLFEWPILLITLWDDRVFEFIVLIAIFIRLIIITQLFDFNPALTLLHRCWKALTHIIGWAIRILNSFHLFAIPDRSWRILDIAALWKLKILLWFDAFLYMYIFGHRLSCLNAG